MEKQFTTDKYASYVYIGKYDKSDIPFKTRQITKSINADYSSKDGRLVGIELLHSIPESIADDLLENSEKLLSTNLAKSCPMFSEGLYYSHVTGRIFEAVIENGSVTPKYIDGGFGPEVSADIFRVQFSIMEYYEQLVEY